jgi:hypothetical protein
MKDETVGLGLTLLVAGGGFLWWGGNVWHAAKRDKAKMGWKILLITLVVLGGLGIGGGLSLLLGLAFLYIKVGWVSLWVIPAIITGVTLLMDLVKRHDWTRTTILGFITAMLIAVPIAPPLLAAAVAHGHHLPQVTSVTTHHKAKG